MNWCNLMSHHESRGVPASRGLTLSAAVLAVACGVALPIGSALAQVQSDRAQSVEERRQQIDQEVRARLREAAARAAQQTAVNPAPPVDPAPPDATERRSAVTEGALRFSRSPLIAGAFDVEYSGGTVGDYVRKFREAAAQDAAQRVSEGATPDVVNIVHHAMCDRIRMPAVSLRGVDLYAAVRGLEGIVPGVTVRVEGDELGDAVDATSGKRVPRSVMITVAISPPAVLQPDWIEEPEPTPPTVDLEFKGGTLREYFDAAVAAGAPLRVVYSGEAVASLRMPPVSVRGVTAEEVRQVADQSLNSPSDARVRFEIAAGSGAAPSGTLIIVRDLMYVEREVSEVYDLSEIDSSTPVEDVLSAVEVAVEINNTSVALKYHEPTRLLLVKGTPSAIQPLSRVIEQLRSRRPAAPRQQP